ncbi:hypothetical protein Rhopal_002815-T1 [Rhodotorula paludigena]|uniref:UspA domain-containing protein n=1 Tax=Rhodotorula paludigena TaxID=86838 RepID=A0AAV5GBK1_9BASI|nr:hypothetical protein Rhopal_002815-T1 [Rhodotorula paludigena]
MNFLSIRRSRKDADRDRDDDDREGRSRGRSLSPWRSSKSASKSRSRSRRREPSAEGMRGDDTEGESDGEGMRPMPLVSPSNAFESDDDSDTASDRDSDGASVGTFDDDDRDDDELFDENGDFFDEEVEKNTEANASEQTPYDFLTREGTTMVYPGEGPNLLPPTDPLAASFRAGAAPSRGLGGGPPPASSSGAATSSSAGANGPPRANPRTGQLPRRKSTRSGTISGAPRLELRTGRPTFEKNRCTVTIVHGEPDRVIEESKGRKQRRRYLVASDLSDEASYAIQWAIGTVIREGDECIIVSVMETDTKFDTEDGNKQAKLTNQRERQAAALQLARQATGLLERTRLNVRVVCQAIHAKVPRHMLVDMIDYLEPTLVLVGSRGLTKLKGMLLGSTSNYLIQKSSAPVMVTRRPLRVSRTVTRKLATLDRTARVRSLADAAIEKESHAQAVDQPEESAEGDDVKERVDELDLPPESLSRATSRETSG